MRGDAGAEVYAMVFLVETGSPKAEVAAFARSERTVRRYQTLRASGRAALGRPRDGARARGYTARAAGIEQRRMRGEQRRRPTLGGARWQRKCGAIAGIEASNGVQRDRSRCRRARVPPPVAAAESRDEQASHQPEEPLIRRDATRSVEDEPGR